MGIRGEIFSTRVQLQNRTYFFNVKENRMGDLYLNIVESKNRDTGGFERQSVILFADDLTEFLTGFDESLRVLERQVREKKRNHKPSLPRGERNFEEREHYSEGTYTKRSYTPDPQGGERERPYRKPRVVKPVKRHEPWKEY